MTKREHYDAILEALIKMDAMKYKPHIDFIRHELELLESRAAARKSVPSKRQKENERLKDEILDYLELRGEAAPLEELVKNIEDITSVQHANALMIQLKKAGKVKSTKEKGKSYYTIIL